MAWAFMAVKHPPSLGVRAVRFLARREHSRAELRRKLAPHAGEGDDLESLLDELAAKGLLSDSRYAEQVARSKARRFGPLRLAHYLKGHGVGTEDAARGIAAAGVEAVATLEGVWASRFRTPPGDDREMARQVRFLQGRGFPLDEVLHFLRRKR